jgi:hypothetical protein
MCTKRVDKRAGEEKGILDIKRIEKLRWSKVL